MTLAPGHFHAALVQKRALAGVHPRAHVYGPLDPDTLAHVSRVATFNVRRENPTAWCLDVRTGPDYLERFLREQPGNTVILGGRNKPKIEFMRLAVQNALNVIADKPWIIDPDDFPALETLLTEAQTREVMVWDVLTERFEITNWLQREFVRDPELFGQWQSGTPQQPALQLHSVHHLKKAVNGAPLARPWWWLDPATSGESLADVGTHLADLALWMIAPDRAVDYKTEVRVLSAQTEPLIVTEEQFKQVTRLSGFPPDLEPLVVNGQFYYAGNGTATFSVRGVHVKMTTAWEYEAADGGGDTHNCRARGTRATVSVRQQPDGRPEVFVSAANPAERAAVYKRLTEKCALLARDFEGLAVADRGAEAQVLVPDGWRASHEDHFGAVMDEYVRYFNVPRALPHWERPNALARYYITTKAVEMARRGG
jgi:hypothetical protein